MQMITNSGMHAGTQKLLPLFSGGTFDAGFNADEVRAPIRFRTPYGTRRAMLEAVITGACLLSMHAAQQVYSCSACDSFSPRLEGIEHCYQRTSHELHS